MNESDLLTIAPILVVVLGTVLLVVRAAARRGTLPPEPTALSPASAVTDRGSLPGCLHWWIILFAVLIGLDVAWMVLAQPPDDCREWCNLAQVVGGLMLGLLALVGAVGFLVGILFAKTRQARDRR
jgi:hypothetical protein